jgi:hypothetical protein
VKELHDRIEALGMAGTERPSSVGDSPIRRSVGEPTSPETTCSSPAGPTSTDDRQGDDGVVSVAVDIVGERGRAEASPRALSFLSKTGPSVAT